MRFGLFLSVMLICQGFITAVIADDTRIRIRQLYQKDMSFSPLAHKLAGQVISVSGYMAPPLKAETHFFVLTKKALSVCPFCEDEAEWPDDIILVYSDDLVSVIPFNYRILVTGKLEIGTQEDPETGFVSRVRLVEADYERE